jgi:hypothetical protein
VVVVVGGLPYCALLLPFFFRCSTVLILEFCRSVWRLIVLMGVKSVQNEIESKDGGMVLLLIRFFRRSWSFSPSFSPCAPSS